MKMMHCSLRISIPFYLHFEGAPSPKTQEMKKSKDAFSSLGSISRPGKRMPGACGYWLPSGKPVTPLLPWKHRFTGLFLKRPRAELDPLWVSMWTSTRPCAPCEWAEDATHSMKDLPGWGDQVVATGLHCCTTVVPRGSGRPRGHRSHAMVSNRNRWSGSGQKVAAGGKGQKKSQ